MKKKLFGIKFTTILTAFLCLLVAIIIWIFVEYDMSLSPTASVFDFLSELRG